LWRELADNDAAHFVASGMARFCGGGGLLFFITYMREVSMSLMLSRSGTETLSVALYELLNYAPYGAMAAFTMVQVVVVFFAAIIFIRFTRSEGITI